MNFSLIGMLAYRAWCIRCDEVRVELRDGDLYASFYRNGELDVGHKVYSTWHLL